MVNMHRYEKKQIEEVNAAIKSERNSVEMYKCLQILQKRMAGFSEIEVAKEFNTNKSKVFRICFSYRSGGIAAMKPKRANCGVKRKMPKEQEKAIIAKLAEKAEKGEFVRVADLRDEFAKESGVNYHLHAFYEVLKRNDWRKVVPRGKHPKGADEETCNASKKLT